MRSKVLFLFIILFWACSSEESYSIINEIPARSATHEDDIFFLHISDTHGSSISVLPMVEVLNNSNCDFGIITGDILPDDYMMNIINSSIKPIFLVSGNHDAYEGQGQYGFRVNVLNKNTTVSNVFYGDDRSNYYYYDLKKSNKVFRVICLDQFEIDAVERVGIHEVIMSQRQIDWFIHVLEGSYSVDGIIILIHEGFGNKFVGQRDTNNTNKFISCLASTYHNSYDFWGKANPLMIPDIIEAYMTGENIINQSYSSGSNSLTINVTTKFIGEHTNFIAYFGGHLHWDEVEYLATHRNQLLVLIAYGGVGTGSKWNDLIKSESIQDSYNINYNVVDFHKNIFTIYRLGAKQTKSGIIRDSIYFDIFK